MSGSKSLIAYLASDDGYNHTYISIPLTERLIKIIKDALEILSEHKEFSFISISGNTINSVSEASEQSEVAVLKIAKNLFKADSDESKICIVNGILPRVEFTYPILNISEEEIYIRAVDKTNDNTYGNTIPTSISTTLVIPEKDE